jgi:hypothetical protein
VESLVTEEGLEVDDETVFLSGKNLDDQKPVTTARTITTTMAIVEKETSVGCFGFSVDRLGMSM